MAALRLRTAPDPVLRRKANRVAKIDGSIQRLVDDMFETMYAAHGVGLAANQVGVSLRVLVLGIPSSREPAPSTGSLRLCSGQAGQALSGAEGKEPEQAPSTGSDTPEGEEGVVQEYVLINPELVKASGEREVDEGCLSVPRYRGQLTRAEWVKVKGLDRDGKPVRLKAEGLTAQALEHEIDHLNGTLYIDRMKEQGTLDTLSELEKPEPAEATAG